MKRTLGHHVAGLLGMGLLLSAYEPVHGTEARVLAVRRGSGDSAALLLKVPDGAELSAQDLSALLDATRSQSREADSRQVRAALNGRRFGDVAVVAPSEPRVSPRLPRRAPSALARATSPRKPAVRAPEKTPPQPVKPDIIIFEPGELNRQQGAPPAEAKKP